MTTENAPCRHPDYAIAGDGKCALCGSQASGCRHPDYAISAEGQCGLCGYQYPNTEPAVHHARCVLCRHRDQTIPNTVNITGAHDIATISLHSVKFPNQIACLTFAVCPDCVAEFGFFHGWEAIHPESELAMDGCQGCRAKDSFQCQQPDCGQPWARYIIGAGRLCLPHWQNAANQPNTR